MVAAERARLLAERSRPSLEAKAVARPPPAQAEEKIFAIMGAAHITEMAAADQHVKDMMAAAQAAEESTEEAREEAEAPASAAADDGGQLAEAPLVAGLAASTAPEATQAKRAQGALEATWLAQLLPPEGASQDLWVFVQKYGWAIRYRVRLAEKGAVDREAPLDVEWVKLQGTLRSPDELLSESDSRPLFDASSCQPVDFEGFRYKVVPAQGTPAEEEAGLEDGVQVTINLMKGRGPQFLIKHNGIFLLEGVEQDREETSVGHGQPQVLTHCWAEVSGLPFTPRPRSMTFFSFEKAVWTADKL